ncbi:MAG TPA: protein kinase, partial [Phycisphaerae bacterium]
MSCPSLETVEGYASGALEERQRAKVAAHLSGCDPCRRQLAEVQENMRAAQQLARAQFHTAVPGPESFAATETIVPVSKPVISVSIPGYQIMREISRGGQGVVYQAIQKSTKRKVALKMLREGHFANAAERARFQREVEILGQLKHPNIVSIYDSGTAGENAYYVMDYVSGLPLDEYVAKQFPSPGLGIPIDKRASRAVRHQSGTRKSGLDDLLRLFGKICDAVHAAHLRGIIHRDLKPSNIRIDDAGEPRVLDFGLAKLASGPEEASPVMTLTGQFIGSLPWSSPEQAEGIPSKIDIRTDVYSLGVLLYQLLTGRFPYEVTGNMRDVL